MKQILLSTFIVGLLLGFLSSTHAHQGDRLYPIVELTDADLAAIDLHDGSIDDWLAVVGEPSMTALDFRITLGSYEPSDMDFRLWLAWHDGTNRIYGAMERADDLYHIFDRSSLDWSGDNTFMWFRDSTINIALDGDHSGGAFARFPCCDDEQAFEFVRQAQPYTAYSDEPHISIDILHNLNPGYEYRTWYIQPPYADAGGRHFGENPVISVTEFYVTPFDHLAWFSEEESQVSTLSIGQVIGFGLAVSDQDNKTGNASTTLNLPERRPVDQEPSADFFADGLLLGASGELPDISVVESITWGRIKASFR